MPTACGPEASTNPLLRKPTVLRRWMKTINALETIILERPSVIILRNSAASAQ